ncbi:OLC1v1011945C1 [Oldenlandia corymbosa var. corymbosa]|uniref:OLC1v1011945C1 n=1 Tax=Oldenlandia corymbosa var. corymbosa TaxID=529605 RepID=A0AAV1DWM2_OLDCO|nr:OLC1v1011945C1 [Oldenlandia corymbosa var. corymbosa]
MMLILLLGVAFVCGAVAILALEGVGLLLFIRHLNRRVAQQQRDEQQGQPGSFPIHHDPSLSHKQGMIWILEPDNMKKDWHIDSLPRDQKRKREIVEVFPIQKHGMVKDNSLFISESDGSRTEVKLRGCTVAAVSATSLSSRKWAKRYPIKVESKGSRLYKGSKILYIYVDTSWEKESWCKALRLASSSDDDKLKWFTKLSLEFRQYVASLNTEYPSFMKPSVGLSIDPIDKSIELDGSSSKVRQFLKKIAKKASKSGAEGKVSGALTLVNDDRKSSQRSRSLRDYGIANMAVAGKLPENLMLPSSSSINSDLGSRASVASDADSDEKVFGDEGTLCWNLLLSRLFFDAKCNGELKRSLKARIQKLLSDMRSPSYIGEITCTSVDPGNLPPYIHAMRVLPSHMDELWAFDVDIEYAGGAVLNIETRLEVQELDFQKGEDVPFESSDVDQVTSDLLETFVQYESDLNNPEEKAEKLDKREGEEADGIRSQKNTVRSSSQVSRWKSMLHSVAKQVSQVPLSLGVRVTRIRGTVRLHIKPPPSDRIWYGFTSMPDLDFNLESSVGDHKITNTHLALLIIGKLKASFRDSLVLPNCESVCIPWMLAEKEDWVPRSVAPMIWIKTDPAGSSAKQGDGKLAVEANRRIPQNPIPTDKRQTKPNEERSTTKQPKNEASEQCTTSSSAAAAVGNQERSVDELRRPLLRINEKGETSERMLEGRQMLAAPETLMLAAQRELNDNTDDEEDSKRKRVRARMLGFGKKMGEKLEEKRRHIEEKGRHIVERMKGPQQGQ